MKAPQDIILKPIVTENSMDGIAMKKYTFRVAAGSTKTEIKEAVEKLFDVKVSKVNTINVRGHVRNYGRFTGFTSAWKKAIVTLTPDSKGIEFFDGMFA